MVTQANDWERPYFEPGRGDAMLHFVVFGTFRDEVLSWSKYRTSGPPEGVQVRKVLVATSESAQWKLDGLWGELLDRDAALSKAVRASPEALYVQGEVKDPANLEYLKDVVGFIAFLLDTGGVGVFDSQTFAWSSPAGWGEDFFVAGKAMIRSHVVILWSEDEEQPNKLWFHTRGLRKFGRPDLSYRGADPENRDDVIELFHRFIGLLARGGWIPEGQKIRLGKLPDGLAAHHAGSLDDPEFNNVHVEFRVPET